MKIIFSILALSLYSFLSYGQYEDILFEDYVYVTNMKSVTFHPLGDPLGVPVTFLDNGVPLVLSFDDMDNNDKDFTYEIIHCNKDWTSISEMERLEYIDGFQDEEIDNSVFSVNTFVPYINYTLPLPNVDLSWTISGNYLLIIYEGGDVDDRLPVITRRFMVVDRQVSVSAINRRPLDVIKLRTHHEFDLFVNNTEFPIIDSRNNVSVTMIQNYRWDSAIQNLNPLFNVGYKMTIDNTGKISFPAYKEFRGADIRTLDYPGNGIHSIELGPYGTDVLLELGETRRDAHYTTVPDANGQFVIQNKDQIPTRQGQAQLLGDRTEGDYAKVIFTLESPELEKEVYVAGKFTDWKPDEMYRMRYYQEKETYIAEIPLKQGYYDYFFAVDNGDYLDPSPIEGSWADTENLYQIFVYLREPGDRYDRLIGYSSINSNDF